MLSNFILAKVMINRRRNYQYLLVKCHITVCFNFLVLSKSVFHFRLIFSLWFIQQVLIILLAITGVQPDTSGDLKNWNNGAKFEG